MKIVRFETDKLPAFGVIEGDKVRELKIGPFETEFSVKSPVFNNKAFDISKVKLLAPCQPSKYLGVGLNFAESAKILGMPVPDNPVLFMKPTTSIIGPGDNIIIPQGEVTIVFEGELALVIGKTAKQVPEKDALDYILGCTCTNDVSDVSKFEPDKGNPTRIKGPDTFGPIGPCIDTTVNPENRFIKTWVNEELRQEGNTKDLIFGIRFLVHYFSSFMTLLPGDIIATGTPPGASPVSAGDVIKVEVEGVGVLKNRMSD